MHLFQLITRYFNEVLKANEKKIYIKKIKFNKITTTQLNDKLSTDWITLNELMKEFVRRLHDMRFPYHLIPLSHAIVCVCVSVSVWESERLCVCVCLESWLPVYGCVDACSSVFYSGLLCALLAWVCEYVLFSSYSLALSLSPLDTVAFHVCPYTIKTVNEKLLDKGSATNKPTRLWIGNRIWWNEAAKKKSIVFATQAHRATHGRVIHARSQPAIQPVGLRWSSNSVWIV